MTLKFAEFAPAFWGPTLAGRELYLAPTCRDFMGSDVLFIATSSNNPGDGNDLPSGPESPLAGSLFAMPALPTAAATLNGVEGEVDSSATFDGATFTFAFADRLFAGRTWRCLTVVYGNGGQTQPLRGYPTPRTVPASPLTTRQIGRSLGVPTRCVRVRRSASDPLFARGEPLRSHGCLGCDGVAIFHHSGRAWRPAFEGSSFSCPVSGLPPSVELDLHVCPTGPFPTR